MENHPINYVPGMTGGQGILGRLIDHHETYGPHVILSFLKHIAAHQTVDCVLDIGAGAGRDLSIAESIFPQAKKLAIESYPLLVEILSKKVDRVIPLNIEQDALPMPNESVDVIIANQMLEHTKEIFWITHEITRSLKVGGYFIMGVPNVASLHNRLLLLLGQHPTQHKLYSAHVRPFSKYDTIKFMEVCFPGGYELVKFAGSQFYPFPAKLTRVFCKLMPNMSFSIFFLFRKVKPYHREFLEHPVKAKLETPFFLGE